MDQQQSKLISAGTGMTAGLEIWCMPTGKKRGPPTVLALVDRSPDGRFAHDVTEWNTAAGLNAKSLKKLKDAKK
jgi:hypothetical protein